MPKFSPDILVALWERAMAEVIGISIETNDPVALRQHLSNARPDGCGDLMTFCPEGVKAVFIVWKTVELPDAQ